jgi:hypothetical protein
MRLNGHRRVCGGTANQDAKILEFLATTQGDGEPPSGNGTALIRPCAFGLFFSDSSAKLGQFAPSHPGASP